MKKLLLIITMLTTACFASIPVKVLDIYDGDTLRVRMENGNKFSTRLSGIDCYETTKIHRAYKQAYENKLEIDEVIKRGNIAKEYLKSLHRKAKEVTFNFMGIDKYGRALGIVYFDGVEVNKELLDKGLCLPYEYRER